MSDWRDRIVGDRMAVDREFGPRVANSEFSNQEWGLIMTAVEFEVEHPEDPDRARLVADTSSVEHVVPELQKVEEAGGVPGAPGGGRGRSDSGDGFVDSVKDALGLGGDDGDDTEEIVARADALTREYADRLQTRLEDQGKWDRVRELAAAEAAGGGEAGTDGPDGA